MPSLTETRYQEQRAHILMAARMVFARKGFHRTSIKDIMNEAGVSNGAIFAYFKNKDQMIIEIIDQNLGLFLQRVEAIADNPEDLAFEDVLIALLELVRQISFGPGRSMSMHVWSLAMLEPEVADHLRSHFENITLSLKRLVMRFQKLGDLPQTLSAQRTAKALFSILIPGYIVQLLLLESIEPRVYLKAHQTLWL
jgi:AcrR family transcriptional regulator